MPTLRNLLWTHVGARFQHPLQKLTLRGPALLQELVVLRVCPLSLPPALLGLFAFSWRGTANQKRKEKSSRLDAVKSRAFRVK